MPKVSIIVPIYNMGMYLEKCIQSLVSQTLKDIEIILVNDGSSDNSLEICNKYKMIDSRIIIIDKLNEGVSIARNVGMEMARSEYITFVDPDDWVEDNMYENMYYAMKNQKVDICLCNYFIEKKERVDECTLLFKEGKHPKEEIEKLILDIVGPPKVGDSSIMGCVWRGMYLKSKIQDNKLIFPVGIRPMQDLLFIIEYLSKCEELYVINKCYYHYYIHTDSAVTGYKSNIWDNNKAVQTIMETILKQASLWNRAKNRMGNRWVYSINWCIANECLKENNKSKEEKIRVIDLLLEDEYTKEYLKYVTLSRKKIAHRILYSLQKNTRSKEIYYIYTLVNFFRRKKINK